MNSWCHPLYDLHGDFEWGRTFLNPPQIYLAKQGQTSATECQKSNIFSPSGSSMNIPTT